MHVFLFFSFFLSSYVNAMNLVNYFKNVTFLQARMFMKNETSSQAGTSTKNSAKSSYSFRISLCHFYWVLHFHVYGSFFFLFFLNAMITIFRACLVTGLKSSFLC